MTAPIALPLRWPRRAASCAAIVDLRAEISPAARSLAAEAGAELLTGHAVVATEGAKAVSAVRVQSYDVATGSLSGDVRTIAADSLIVSGGWSPVVHLASQAGGKPRWSVEAQAFLPPEPTQNWIGAGAFSGRFSTAEALAQGHAAGIAATGAPETPVYLPESSTHRARAASGAGLRDQGQGQGLRRLPARRDRRRRPPCPSRRLRLGRAPEALHHARHGDRPGQDLQRAGLAIMAEALGAPIEDVGTTRFRPPFSPVSLGALAAERYGDLRPERLTPMHDWHVAQGARMYAAGLWFRPMIYGQPGESVEQAYVREARAVRTSAGIVDVSTLGKIAVQGPDAALSSTASTPTCFPRLPSARRATA